MNKNTSEMCVWFVLARYVNRKQTRSQNFNDRSIAFVSAFFFRSDHVSIKQLLRVTKRLRAYYTTYLNLREFRREKFFRYAGHSGISLSSVYEQVRGVDWKLFWLDTTLTHPTGEGNSWKKKSRPTFSWSSIMLHLLRITTKRII